MDWFWFLIECPIYYHRALASIIEPVAVHLMENVSEFTFTNITA